MLIPNIPNALTIVYAYKIIMHKKEKVVACIKLPMTLMFLIRLDWMLLKEQSRVECRI